MVLEVFNVFVLTGKSPAGSWRLQYNCHPQGQVPWCKVGPLRNVPCFKSPDMKKFLPRCFRTQLRVPLAVTFGNGRRKSEFVREEKDT